LKRKEVAKAAPEEKPTEESIEVKPQPGE